MIAKIVKTILRMVKVEITYRDGDMVRLILTLGGKTVFDREIDIIKGA